MLVNRIYLTGLIRNKIRGKYTVFIGLIFWLTVCSKSFAQEWHHYGGDLGGRRYSLLKQITRENVNQLRPAWIYRTGDISDGSQYPVRSAFECTPLVIDGILYLTTPFCRVIALDSETGRLLWTYDPKLDKEKSYNLFVNRGVAYWSKGEDKRVYLGTLDGRLIALNAKTGQMVSSFGKSGVLDLRAGFVEDFTN